MSSGSTFPPLHVVTDDAVLAGARFIDDATEILRVGGEGIALHLRGRETPGRVIYETAAALVPIARRSGALLLVNDRVDVALASGASGAQLGSRSISLVDARRLMGPERYLGASVHGRAEAEDAARDGADFLLVGTLFASRSHPGRPAVGVGILHELADLDVPLIGIGGIDPARAAEVRGAAAVGIAVLGGVWAAQEPAEAVAVYLRASRRFDENAE